MKPIQRETARVIPVCRAGRVLLVCGHDPQIPERHYWFTIGGQIEPSETARAAAVRELHEEVGLVVRESDLVGPFHQGEHTYSLDGVLYCSRSTFFTVLIPERRVRPRGLPGEMITDAAWWDLGDLSDVPVSNPLIPLISSLAVALMRSDARSDVSPRSRGDSGCG